MSLIVVVEFLHHSDGAIIKKYLKSEPVTVLHGSKTREIINEHISTLKQSFVKISNALYHKTFLYISIHSSLHAKYKPILHGDESLYCFTSFQRISFGVFTHNSIISPSMEYPVL